MQAKAAAGRPHAEIAPHSAFILSARTLYTEDVQWVAPGRGITRSGREEVIRHLLREASGMHAPEFTTLRRFEAERQIVDEYAVRFTYTGEGIEQAPIRRGELIELKRVRILELDTGRVTRETCIETWSVLPRDNDIA